jgi:hypothetical protein
LKNVTTTMSAVEMAAVQVVLQNQVGCVMTNPASAVAVGTGPVSPNMVKTNAPVPLIVVPAVAAILSVVRPRLKTHALAPLIAPGALAEMLSVVRTLWKTSVLVPATVAQPPVATIAAGETRPPVTVILIVALNAVMDVATGPKPPPAARMIAGPTAATAPAWEAKTVVAVRPTVA